MKTELFPCPACKKPHALQWFNKKRGRQLVVVCNMDERNKVVVIPKELVDNMDERELVGLPEFSTPEAKKKSSDKGNLQLILMSASDGVERGIPDLPRGKSKDDAVADELKYQIEQCLQAQAETTSQITKLATKRTTLENQERELRKKLREVWTEPLKLE